MMSVRQFIISKSNHAPSTHDPTMRRKLSLNRVKISVFHTDFKNVHLTLVAPKKSFAKLRIFWDF
jgi:hypothetical protein